jgi:hypothetical protein
MRKLAVFLLPVWLVASCATKTAENKFSDEKYAVWVKDTPTQQVETGSGEIPATELWIKKEPNGEPRLLVKGRYDPDIKKTIAGISNPCFSVDRKNIYFVSEAWATSGSIQRVAVDGGAVNFVIDGNSVDVIQRGHYSGKLLVERALLKSDKNGETLGREMYLWLVDVDGRPIKEIGLADDESSIEFRKGCGK